MGGGGRNRERDEFLDFSVLSTVVPGERDTGRNKDLLQAAEKIERNDYLLRMFSRAK